MYFLSFCCTGRLTQIWALKEMPKNHGKAVLHILRTARRSRGCATTSQTSLEESQPPQEAVCSLL